MFITLLNVLEKEAREVHRFAGLYTVKASKLSFYFISLANQTILCIFIRIIVYSHKPLKQICMKHIMNQKEMSRFLIVCAQYRIITLHLL